jgi:protein gp37
VGEFSAITWTDASFNPWVGCTRITPACDFCYAAQMMDTRLHRAVWGGPGKGDGTRVRTSRANWGKPLTWDRKAAANGTRPLVFTASLADVFDNAVDPQWRVDLFDLIRATPHLYWLVLTKRPFNVLGMMYGNRGGHPPLGAWPRNAALGATCEDRARLEQNAPHLIGAQNLLGIPVLFVSYEPALEPIADLAREFMRPLGHQGIGWWLVGGESQQGAGHVPRESDPQWFRDVRDACAETGALFHMKQMRDHGPIPDDLMIRGRPDVSRYCA